MVERWYSGKWIAFFNFNVLFHHQIHNKQIITLTQVLIIHSNTRIPCKYLKHGGNNINANNTGVGIGLINKLISDLFFRFPYLSLE